MSRALEVELPVERPGPAAPSLAERPSKGRRGLVLLLTRVVLVGAILVVWQYAAERLIDPFWISSPAEVWARLRKLAIVGDSPWEALVNFPSTDLVFHLRYTFQEMILGLVYGTLAGTVVGFVLGRARFLGDLINPLIIAIYSLPKLALAPLFILWFGLGIES
ncbi:MAG: hypothetical protein HYU88_07200, partial [Chloroflexi bacterium]|nr:hypothetical protein [Chloroflexota bacterium]